MDIAARLLRERTYTPRLSTILVHAGSSSGSEALIDASVQVANIHGAKLIGVSTPPELASMPLSSTEERAVTLILKAAGSRFEDLESAVRCGLVWRVEEGPPNRALKRFAWAADLIMANSTVKLSAPRVGSALRELVTQAARPVLLRPLGLKRTRFARVAVLWNESAACGRAVAAALPFIGRADSVHLLVGATRLGAGGDPRLAQFREGLDLRGVGVETTSLNYGVENAQSYSEALDEMEPDLVIMGAWWQPRWLSFIDPTDVLIARLRSFAMISH